MSEAKKIEVLEKKLKNLQEEYDQFAYIVSHDFSAPFRQIQGFLKIIQKNNHQHFDEKSLYHFDLVLGATENCQNYISNLLDFSRAKVSQEQFKVINFEDLENEVKHNLKSQISATKAKVEFNNMPNNLLAEHKQLVRIFKIIIENAIKFQEVESIPQIFVSCEDSGDKKAFSITDNGIGISEKYSEDIFTIFRKAGTGDEYKGSGVGLALAKKLVLLHGGDIWLESGDKNNTKIKFTI